MFDIRWTGFAGILIGLAKRFIPVIGLLLATLPSSAYADAVTDWSAIALTAAAVNAKRSPNAATFDLTYVHVAIYDAVNAIEGGHTSFSVRLTDVPAGASQEAATAAAAYTVLRVLYTSQQAFWIRSTAQRSQLFRTGPPRTRA